MRNKLKLSLLDDYLALNKILIFCTNFQINDNDLNAIKLDCQNLLAKINSIFENANKTDFAFAIFKQEIFESAQIVNKLNFIPSLNLQNNNLFCEFNNLKQKIIAKINKLSPKTAIKKHKF